MELWMIYSICAAFIMGIGGFLQKIEVERNLSKTSFLVYCNLGIVIGLGLYFLFTQTFLVFDIYSILFAGCLSTIYTIIFKFRLKSQEYISSSSYFINYRIFSSILLLGIGQFLYNEYISLQEYIGVFLGFIIFYLLIEKRKPTETNKQMWKGYGYLLIGIIGITLIWVLQKKLILLDVDIATYIFISGVTGVILPLLLKKKSETLKQVFYIKEFKDKLLLFFAGFTAPLGMLFNLLAIDAGGDIAIIYKIISYSLFIPVILSVIVYKESVTWKKLLAFILTIASIGLFV